MNNLISTIYVTLWISSFYSRDDEGQQAAKNLSASLNGSSMGLALMVSMYVGYRSDKSTFNKLLILVFASSAIGLFTFYNLYSPESSMSYLAMIFLNIGNQC